MTDTKTLVETIFTGAALRSERIPDLSMLFKGIDEEAEARHMDPGDVEVFLDDCEILQCDCSDMSINQPFGFAKTTFCEQALFLGTVFNKYAGFHDSTFRDIVIFDHATFATYANFARVKSATFLANRARRSNQPIDERGMEFMEERVPMMLPSSLVPEGATFPHAAFFRKTTFGGEAYFTEAVFKIPVRFSEATFVRHIDFSNATLAEGAEFDRATFEQVVTLTGVRISREVDMRTAAFGDDARLRIDEFSAMNDGGIHLAAEQIKKRHGCLIFGEDSDAKTIGSKELLRAAAAQYNMLRNNFRRLPIADKQEDLCHYRYMDLRRRSSDWNCILRFLDLFLLKWCGGYGICTWRILATMAAVILLCAGIYGGCEGPDTIKGYYPASPPRNMSVRLQTSEVAVSVRPAESGPVTTSNAERPSSDFSALYFSAITFTTIGYGDYAPLGTLKFVACVEGFVGLFLMAVFTVCFTRKMIR